MLLDDILFKKYFIQTWPPGFLSILKALMDMLTYIYKYCEFKEI